MMPLAEWIRNLNPISKQKHTRREQCALRIYKFKNKTCAAEDPDKLDSYIPVSCALSSTTSEKVSSQE